MRTRLFGRLLPLAVLAALVALALSGCGQKGDLYLPTDKDSTEQSR